MHLAGEGKWQAQLTKDAACGGGDVATLAFTVGKHSWKPPETPRTSLWMQRAEWSPALEDLYSAWIERMFDAPLEAQPSWNALHEVLRDKSRNFLFDHLGAAEGRAERHRPPRLRRPTVFSPRILLVQVGPTLRVVALLTRQQNGTAPTCTDFATSSEPFPTKDPDPGAAPPPPPVLPAWADPDRPKEGQWEDNVKGSASASSSRTTLADAAQSGAGRTPADDDTGDYYPIKLSTETLRPGTVFADPYGHVLVVAKRIAQTPTSGGVLLAVDGQPDGTVARKRFWRGNFLFAVDPALGERGLQALPPDRTRPHHEEDATPRQPGARRFLADGPVRVGGVEGFYDKMEDVLSPAPQDPMQALLETIQALEEQVKTRALSVDNGRKFLASGRSVADMPDGAKIFETTGDWEDFSTPSRDLRLLIAIDVARNLPARIARRPGALRDARREDRRRGEGRPRGAARDRAEGANLRLHAHRRLVVEAHPRPGVRTARPPSRWAYNPNECVESRWGAPDASDEAST